MDKNIVSLIKDKFVILPSYIEENIKIHIIIEVLKRLGYSQNSFDFEHPIYHVKGKVDIAINVDNVNWLYIEIKRGDVNLTNNDIMQLANYINSKGIEWGILTNGKEFILFNNNIEVIKSDDLALKNKIVFSIDMFKNKNIWSLKYLTKEAIFESKVTYYFKSIAQYKSYRFPDGGNTWEVYKGTLNDFFIYYSNKEGKHRNLKEIRIDDFKEYLDKDQKKKRNVSKSINSDKTFKNKCSHINSMLKELKKRGKISEHNFQDSRESLISELDYEIASQNKDYLNIENINQIIEYLKQTQNSVRNMTIFMFSIYIGIERSIILNLGWDMVNLDKGLININGREIPLPNKLLDLLRKLKKENKEKNIKGKFLFYKFYRNRYEKITEDVIHYIYKELEKIDNETNKWASFSPQYIRNRLVEKLFDNGFHLEEIVYLTGMDLNSISNILTFKKICEKANTKIKKKIKEHPFSKVVE